MFSGCGFIITAQGKKFWDGKDFRSDTKMTRSRY